MKWFCLAVVFAAGCSAPAPAPGPTASEAPPQESTTAVPAAPSPVRGGDAKEPEITIENVEVANPVGIAGRARTFENNVVLRVRDESGELLAEGFTTSAGEMGQRNPYRGTLWLPRDPGRRITVEALEYSAKDGSERSLTRVQKDFGVEPVSVRLYFPDATCTTVKPFTRRVPKSISAARLRLEALLAGPLPKEKSEGAAAPFPQGSAIRSVNLRDGVLVVDFNERLQNVGGSCQAQMIRESVTATLRELPEVKQVTIMAGGSEALALQP